MKRRLNATAMFVSMSSSTLGGNILSEKNMEQTGEKRVKNKYSEYKTAELSGHLEKTLKIFTPLRALGPFSVCCHVHSKKTHFCSAVT